MDTTDDYVEVFLSQDGWRWHRKSTNHLIVSGSGEAFTSHTYALESAAALNEGCPIIDTDQES